MAHVRGERQRVYNGLQIAVGPIRILVSTIKDEVATVNVILNNEVTHATPILCPVATFEDLLDWYEELEAQLHDLGASLERGTV
jgi:hypothetical protein